MANQARDDAADMAMHFVDEIVSQLVESGEASDDLLNDYPGGDSYHHEHHVDRSYSLLEAAELLDEYDDYEETDSDLWQGLPPRRAIECQAAYTYGNAVYSEWREIIKQINDALADGDYGDFDEEPPTAEQLKPKVQHTIETLRSFS